MKTTRILGAAMLVLFVSLFATSCSDSDSSSTNNNGDVEESFNYTYSGQEINITTWQAIRTEDRFAVTGLASNGDNISLEFNKYGNIATAYAVSGFNMQASFVYNKSEYFQFEIVSLDEENKVVEATFTGRVYDDEYDFSSDFVTVSGSFKVQYTETAAEYPGLHFDAKINGNNWYSTTSAQSYDSWNNIVEISTESDDKYQISLVLDANNVTTGSYTFNGTNEVNIAKVGVFSATEGYPLTASTTSGTLTISDVTTASGYTFITGTYSLTAIDPITNTTITVTNGSFKSAYENY